MASEDTMLGNEFKFQVGNGASPEVFTPFCAVVDTGAIGEEKPQVDVTALCDQARAYRSGLADGVSIPLKVNFIQGDTATRDMYQMFKNDTLKTFRLTENDTSPEEYFEFSAVCLGWNVTPAVGAATFATFTLKISGELTWVYA